MTGSLNKAMVWAIGFSNLAMLGWLVAAAIPLLIHLWSRRRYHEAPWAAVEFLLAAMRKRMRRVRFEQWLLLALRTALVVLVVIALAEPFWGASQQVQSQRRAMLHLFVVDDSLSMWHVESGESRAEVARNAIRKIVESSGSQDGFGLIAAGDAPRVIVNRPSREDDLFLRAVDAWEPRDGASAVQAALAAAARYLATHAAMGGDYDAAAVYVLSDFAEHSWLSWARGDATAQAALAELAVGQQVVLLNVAAEGQANTTVTAIDFAGKEWPSVGEQVLIQTRVINRGPTLRSRVSLRCEVGGEEVARQQVDLPAGDEVEVSFPFRWKKKGPQVVSVHASADDMPQDDHRHRVVTVRDTVRVLCIEGRRGAGKFLATALTPEPEQRQVEVTQASESALVERSLDAYDLLLLAEVAQPTAGETAAVRQFLDQGKGVAWFLGPDTNVEAYNRELASESEPLWPLRLLGPAPFARHPFDPLDYRHPLVAPFRGNQRAGLLTTPIFRYHRVEAIPGAESTTALAFSGGDPAIVLSKAGKGRVAIVTTPADLQRMSEEAAWNAWPAWPSFLPIVRNMAVELLASEDTRFNLEVGAPLEGRNSSPAVETVEITAPSGVNAQVRLAAAEQGKWRFANTARAGVYRTSTPDAPMFAVNPPQEEGDLSPAKLTDLPEGVTLVRGHQDALQSVALASAAVQGRQRWLLVAALVFFFAELFVAGRHTRSTA